MRDMRSTTNARHETPVVQAERAVLGPLARAYVPFKTVVEWMAAAVMLVMAAPVLGALAVLLKLTSEGPVFYQQTRLGRGGRPFQIYKLRTMTHQAEAITGPVWSIAGDPRVTPVGRWLRDTHLDEVPQLWNILRGDMSLIGPRPERPVIAEKIERAMPEFRDRLRVRPGITGLAQMRQPADTDLHVVRRKLAHDLHYIACLGPLIDATIVVSTGLHFVGMAATAVSRLMVRPFAPELPDEELAAMVEPELPVSGHRIGPVSGVKAKEELPWAA